jgi:hypothetical protein
LSRGNQRVQRFGPPACSAQNWLKISEPVIDSPATYSNAGIELFLATERRSKNLGAMSWSTLDARKETPLEKIPQKASNRLR